MSELILILAGVVSFALLHAAHPRRFPFGEARWHRLNGRLGGRLGSRFGGPRRTLHALAFLALALGLGGACYGLHPLGAVEAILIAILAITTAGSAIVLAAPLWPRVTWRLCLAAAVTLPILVTVSLALSLAAQVLHG